MYIHHLDIRIFNMIHAQIKWWAGGGSSEKGSHVYFLLQVSWVILLSICTIVWYTCCFDATIDTWCHSSTIWRDNNSTMAPINRKYTWLHFCFCLLECILYEVLRIGSMESIVTSTKCRSFHIALYKEPGWIQLTAWRISYIYLRNQSIGIIISNGNPSIIPDEIFLPNKKSTNLRYSWRPRT